MKPIESKRIALDRMIVLRFPDFEGFVADFAANLSMSGMFVRSREPRRAGTPVSFELRLEDGAPLVRGSGWVVWSRNKREALDRPAGMGVEFTKLDDKSRRLIRWLILNQLPEGEKPYDVHGETASAPATSRLVSQAAAPRNRRAGVATALLIFIVLAALVYRGTFRRPDAGTGRTPVESPVAVSADPVSAEVGDSTATTAPTGLEDTLGEGSEQPVSQETTSDVAGAGEVEAVIKSWASAWSNQDVDRYLSHYALDFVPEGGLSRTEWVDLRTKRLTAPKRIRVAVTRLEAKIVEDVGARVSFLQTYRSDGYADTVDKVMELGLEDGVWKIRREVAD